MNTSVFDRVKNIMGKGENAGYQHFLLNVFKMILPKGRSKSGLWGKGLTLSQTTNFSLFQIKRVCRRQFWIWWKWQKVIQMVRKHWGKRRNCSLRAISPFSTVFSKGFYCRHVKTGACLGKGYLFTKQQICWLHQIQSICTQQTKPS